MFTRNLSYPTAVMPKKHYMHLSTDEQQVRFLQLNSEISFNHVRDPVEKQFTTMMKKEVPYYSEKSQMSYIVVQPAQKHISDCDDHQDMFVQSGLETNARDGKLWLDTHEILTWRVKINETDYNVFVCLAMLDFIPDKTVIVEVIKTPLEHWKESEAARMQEERHNRLVAFKERPREEREQRSEISHDKPWTEDITHKDTHIRRKGDWMYYFAE